MNRKVFVVLETILLVIFITATIILAQRWKFDPEKGFIPTAGIRVMEVKHATVEVGNTKRDDTPITIDYLTDSSYTVKISKNGRQDWINTVKVIPQYVTTVLPVLFPKEISKDIKLTNIEKVYPVLSNDNFFYTKYNSSKILELRRFSINQNIFGESTEDKKILEFPSDEKGTATVMPSPTGDKVLIVRNNLKYVVDGNTTAVLGTPIVFNGSADQIAWSKSERFLIASVPGEGIYSYDIAGKLQYTIAINDTNNTYTFLDTDSSKILLLKTQKTEADDLAVVTTVPTNTSANEVLSLLQINLDGKNPENVALSNDSLKGIKRGFIFPNPQSLVLEFDNQVKIVNTQNQTPKVINGEKVVSMYQEDEILITSSDEKVFETDFKNDKNYEMSIDTTKISDLIPYFKNSNMLYLKDTSNKDIKDLDSNYVTGGVETNIDSGNIQPLIGWKKNDFVRIFYSKVNSNNLQDVVGVEFEN